MELTKSFFYLQVFTLVTMVSFSANAGDMPLSATVLEFAGDNTLLVADSDGGQIIAYRLPDVKPAKASVSYNLTAFDKQLSKFIEVDREAITFQDMVIHPVSKKAYISLMINDDGKRIPAIVSVDPAGNLSRVELSGLEDSRIKLKDTAKDKVTFWRDIPASSLKITDLDYTNGYIYVSGLSTGEFASTLRKIPFPFKDGKEGISHIAIYHTVHDQIETRAPIRAMTVMNIDGEQTVVAAYTCTPLVTIPESSLTDGSHVTGKTIAELGYANLPLDIVQFVAMNEHQKQEEFILVVNKERSADLIRLEDIKKAMKEEGLSKPIMWNKAGLKTRPIPLAGVLHIADQDQQFLTGLRRDIFTGGVELVSFRKGVYFRLSDFISEYNFPDYKYPKDQKMIKGIQNMLKTDAGYKDLVR
ncbi:hypothetical protein L4C34_17305 [Vibrio profundum]|uniref:hypothetical protein n=1 Tax=Vibrio profundum TaxID=2910247 RepID=UPI003D0CEC78